MTDFRLGQLGLGVIGRIYAGHLLRRSGHLVVYDLRPDRVHELAAAGAVPAETPAELARASDAIVVSLPNPDAVSSAFLGPDGVLAGAREGLLVVDTSTVDPSTSQAIHTASAALGVDYLDAPVSGGQPMEPGTEGAKAASVSFIVGGDRAAFERAIQIFEMLGSRWFYLGPSGSGSTVKLISNLMAGLHNLVAAEAFVLGAAAGFSPATLLEVFDGTDARSYHLTDYFAPRIERGDFEPGFSIDLQYKDHRLAGELGQRLGVPLFLNELAVQLYLAMRGRGMGGKDIVEAVRFIGELANADIYAPRPFDTGPTAPLGPRAPH